MKRRRVAIAAAVFVHLLAVSLEAQVPRPQSKQQLTNALQEYRDKKDGHGEALTLLQLGMAEAGSGNVTAARNDLVEAVDKMRADNDFAGAWVALLTLSQIEVALGRHAEAIPHLERAFTVLNEAKASTVPLDLKTLMALGSVPGVSPEMVQSLNGPGAVAVKSLMIQYSFEPMTHDLYGSVLTQVGQLEKAEAELKAAGAGAALSQGLYDFSIELHWGDLRFRQQRYEEARAHYVKALNSASTPNMLSMGGRPIQASIYDRLVRLETITGHPEEAKRWSQKALGKKLPDDRN